MLDNVRSAIIELWPQSDNRRRQNTSSLNFEEHRLAIRRLEDAVVEALIARGVDESWILQGSQADMPGAYGIGRPWDIVVVKDDVPLAAIIWKTLHGPNVLHFINERIHELISCAFDVRRKYGIPGLDQFRPHLGLLFAMDDCASANRPHTFYRDSRYPRLGDGLSPKDRLSEVLKRFREDALYDEICYVASTTTPHSTMTEPGPQMDVEGFIDGMVQAIKLRASAQDRSGLTAQTFGELLARRGDVDAVMSGVTSTPEGLQAAEQAIIRRRREIIAKLRKLALAPDTNESIMQKALESHFWLFGGQYVGVVARRDLMNLHQHDIPLVAADQSLTIIELKGPEASLVRQPRPNHLTVSSAVNEAVGQCMNYLRTLDELGPGLRTVHRTDLGLDYDYRRARATVIIGHPDRSDATRLATREQIDQTLRTYNAHLSRIHVQTYADLLDSAERALTFQELGRS